jgi:ABC-type proline/glycine betaine transport system permease subunit
MVVSMAAPLAVSWAALMVGQWDLWESTMVDLSVVLLAALLAVSSAVLMADLSVAL